MPSHSTTRWITFLASVGFMICSGLHYAWSIYSQDLKEKLGLTQEALDGLGTCKDLGAYFGIFGGMFFNRFGPQMALLVGAFLTFFGFILIYLRACGELLAINYPMLCILFILGSNGMAWYDATALGVTLRNFPTARGMAAGSIKSFIGISSAIFSSLYLTFFSPRVELFLLIIAIVPCSTGVIGSFFVRQVHSMDSMDEEDDRLLFTYVGAIVFALSFMMLGNSVLDPKYHDFAAIMCALSLFGLLPYFSSLQQSPRRQQRRWGVIDSHETDFTNSLDTHLLSNECHETSDSEANNKIPRDIGSRHLRLGDNHTLVQALSSGVFWLCGLLIMLLCGSGLAVINNLNQIARIRNAPLGTISTLVSIVSIFNGIGRILFGFLSDLAIRKYSLPRASFLGLSSFIMCCSLLTLGHVGGTNIVIVCSVFIGLSFGGLIGLTPSLSADYFGVKYVSSVTPTLALSAVGGSFLLGTMIVGGLYDVEAKKQHLHGNDCIGIECFRASFDILALSCGVSMVLSIILCIITRDLYGQRRTM